MKNKFSNFLCIDWICSPCEFQEFSFSPRDDSRDEFLPAEGHELTLS